LERGRESFLSSGPRTSGWSGPPISESPKDKELRRPLNRSVMQLSLSFPGPMSADVVQLYLCYITFHPLLFGYIWFVQWLTSYPKPVPTAELRIALLRNFLFLAIAGIGWLLFVTNLLYWSIFVIAMGLDLAVFYLTKIMAKRLHQRSL